MYLITLCTDAQQPYFGEIRNGKMFLTEMGECITDNLVNVSTRYPYAQIPFFEVMPEHIHAIVCIVGDCRDVACNVSTLACNVYTVIRGIQSATAHYAQIHAIPFAWETQFDEHSTPDGCLCTFLTGYIENNRIKGNEHELNASEC